MTKDIKPTYYQHDGRDVIDTMYDLYGANARTFLIGNIIKYIYRYKGKNGVEDLYKARTYLNRLIKKEEKKE